MHTIYVQRNLNLFLNGHALNISMCFHFFICVWCKLQNVNQMMNTPRIGKIKSRIQGGTGKGTNPW